MNTILLSKIIIPEGRQRENFDPVKLMELSANIEEVGLLHPIVLRNDGETLVAGERRLRALAQTYEEEKEIMHDGEAVDRWHVPYVTVGELSAYLLRKAELVENTGREPLTWQEAAKALTELDEILAQENPHHLPSDTAKIAFPNAESNTDGRTGYYTNQVTKAKILAEHLNDPDVAKAKDAKEAEKIITRKNEQLLRQQMAASYDTSKTPHKFVKEDAISFLRSIPDATFDVVCTDPPYGIGADKFGDQAQGEHVYDDSYKTWAPLMRDFADQLMRVCKASAHVYIWCDIRRFFAEWVEPGEDVPAGFYRPGLFDILKGKGFYVWPRPIIWYKGNEGTLPRPDYGPRNTYECVLFASKGSKQVVQVGAHDCVVGCLPDDKRIHAAQKPVSVYKNLLNRSANPGDTVGDFFTGSGTIFPAANQLSLRVFACENNEDSYNMAKLRMEDKD